MGCLQKQLHMTTARQNFAGTTRSESHGASVHLLEGKAEDGNLLAGHSVEHAGDDHLHKAVLLVVVDLDHRVPVVGHPLQAHALTATSQPHTSAIPAAIAHCVQSDSTSHAALADQKGSTGPHQMYTRLRMSFWKQEPPKPTDAFRNLGPMRESVPAVTMLPDSITLLPVSVKCVCVPTIPSPSQLSRAQLLSSPSSALSHHAFQSDTHGSRPHALALCRAYPSGQLSSLGH